MSETKELVAVLPGRECVIIRLDEAVRAIAEARRVEDVKEIRDQAQAVEHFARERRLSKDAILDAAEIKVRAERRLGELLHDVPRAARGKPSIMEGLPTLAKLQLTYQDSHRCQRIAGIANEVFLEHIAAKREEFKTPGSMSAGITTAGLLKIADPPEKKTRAFNVLAEAKAVREWLEKRRALWPEGYRDRFLPFVRRVLDGMENHVDAPRGEGDCGASPGEGEDIPPGPERPGGPGDDA